MVKISLRHVQNIEYIAKTFMFFFILNLGKCDYNCSWTSFRYRLKSLTPYELYLDMVINQVFFKKGLKTIKKYGYHLNFFQISYKHRFCLSQFCEVQLMSKTWFKAKPSIFGRTSPDVMYKCRQIMSV